MKIRTSLLIQFGILLLACAISAYYASVLPDQVPTHWNIHNQVDGYGSKWVTLLMLPIMTLFSIFMTVFLPRLSPKNFEIERFANTFAYSMVLVEALFLYIAIIILKATLTGHMDFGKMMMAGIFGFFALFGNVLGKIRRNFYMGIRTPWTIASEPVWDATHRAAGYLWFVGGLVGAALALAGLPIMISVGLLVAMAFWPVVHSYFLYKKLGDGTTGMPMP